MKQPKPFIYDRGTFTGYDTQTTEGIMFYMTNSLCEPSHWIKSVFEHLSIPYGITEDGAAYPLTEEEQQYIASDEMAGEIRLPKYGRSREFILFGYTIWWQNKKWLAPTIEFSYDEDDAYEYEDTLGMVDRIATHASKIVIFNEILKHARFLISDDMEARVCLTMLIPLNTLLKRKKKDSESYFRTLKILFNRIGANDVLAYQG